MSLPPAERERAHWNSVAWPSAVMRGAVAGDSSELAWRNVDDLLHRIEEALDVRAGGHYAELGCGPGRLLGPLSNSWPDAVWVGYDIAELLLAQLPTHPNLHARVTDGRNLDGISGEFDGFFCVTVFQHIPWHATRGYFHEVRRLLRPGGRFYFQYVLADTHQEMLDSGEFLHSAYTDVWIADACSGAGLEMIDFRFEEGNHWTWATARRPEED